MLPAADLDRRLTLALKIVGLVILAWLVIDRLAHYFTYLRVTAVTAIGSLFLAYLLFPAVQLLNRRLRLWQSIAIVYGAVLALLGLLLWFIVPIVAGDLQSLIEKAPAIDKRLSEYLSSPATPFLGHLPGAVRTYVSAWPQALSVYYAAHTSALIANLLGWLFSFVAIALLCIAIPVTSIYLLTEADAMKAFVLGFFPDGTRARARAVIEDLDKVVGGFVRGQLLVAGSVAAMSSALMLALHVPYALLIALWAGVVDIVPYLGAIAGAVPAIVLALVTHGPWSALLVALGFAAINQIEGNLLTPRIVSRTVGVSPLAVIFSLVVCGELFGIIGLLIAVPLAGTVRVLIDHLHPSRELPPEEVGPALSAAPREAAEHAAATGFEAARSARRIRPDVPEHPSSL
jgi:predicted PurR-regulated permease PerM